MGMVVDMPIAMVVMGVTVPVHGIHSFRLDRRAGRVAGCKTLLLGSQLALEPVQPGSQLIRGTGGEDCKGGRAGQVPQIAFGALRLELGQQWQQVGLGAQHQVGRAEHHRILGGFVVALGDREQGHVAVLAQVEARRTDQVTHVLDEEDVETRQVQPVQGLVDHVGIQVAGAAGGDLYRRDPLGTDTQGVVLCLQVALDHGDPQPSTQGIDGGLQEAGLARPRGGHQVQGQHPIMVEVFTIMGRLMVVLREQPLQHGYGRPAIRGLGEFAVSPDQVLVAGGDVAAAGITHRSSPNRS